jgi:flagellar basal-body rod protein FlgG
MLPIFQSPASGMISHQQMIDVVSNNLANLNTPGFKAARTQFQELLYRRIPTSGQRIPAPTEPIGGPGTSPRLRDLLGAGVRLGATGRDLEAGVITPDGNPLHAAVNGEGFFIVQLADGSAGYTRDGGLARDQLGRLVTANGDVVLPETRVPADASGIRIDSSGLIFASVPDEAGGEVELQLGELQLARFINPDGLIAVGQNLFLASDASGPALVGYPGDEGYGSIVGGALESSNVDLATEFTNLLIGQRAYALSARALQTMDDMLGMANNLRR